MNKDDIKDSVNEFVQHNLLPFLFDELAITSQSNYEFAIDSIIKELKEARKEKIDEYEFNEDDEDVDVDDSIDDEED